MAKRRTSLKRRVEEVFAENFSDFESGLMMSEDNLRLLGYIVSSSFVGKSRARRRALVDKLLGEALEEDELAKVGPIVPMTPAEADIGDNAA